MELHKARKNKSEKKFYSRGDKSSQSFRNFRNDRNSSYSRDNKESTTVNCSDCGIECSVPFIPKTNRPIYCSKCFRKNKPYDSESDDFYREKPRLEQQKFHPKIISRSKLTKKQENFFSGGSEKFYNTLKEKLFENLGGKACSGCGFKDERALGFRNIFDDSFDNVKRGGFASSWGKYISDPELARQELKILCLNCNEISKTNAKPEKKDLGFKKKKKRFPR